MVLQTEEKRKEGSMEYLLYIRRGAEDWIRGRQGWGRSRNHGKTRPVTSLAVMRVQAWEQGTAKNRVDEDNRHLSVTLTMLGETSGARLVLLIGGDKDGDGIQVGKEPYESPTVQRHTGTGWTLEYRIIVVDAWFLWTSKVWSTFGSKDQFSGVA